jgi:hypothetical protein
MGDAPPPTRPQAAHINTRLEVRGRIAATAFGAYIAVTSAAGISLGLHAGEGWLAIIYGALGVSMGVAGMAGVWMKGALRGALLGWFLVGVASRAIVEGDAYLAYISFPIAVALVSALAFELLYRRSAAKALGAAAGGCLAILSLPALAITAPSMPAMCSSAAAFGRSQSMVFRYPATTLFDAAEERYTERCLTSMRPPP